MKLTKTIYLCGFMGCGKSTLGRFAARKLGYPIVDTDYIITKKAGCSINEIFSEKGEEYFRKLETKVIRSLSYQKPRVVSLGGGSVLKDKNVKYMKRSGLIVFLDTPFEVVYERVRRNNRRPIARRLDKEGLRELFEERRKRYQKVADIIIASEYNVRDTYNKLMSELRYAGLAEE